MTYVKLYGLIIVYIILKTFNLNKIYEKLIILLMFLSFESYSQDFLGKAYYMSKSSVNMDWMKNMPPERQKNTLKQE